jgi:hypothetical protein
MSDEDKAELEQLLNNVVSIDDGRLKRLADRGHYNSLLEKFDILRIKFIYDDLKSKEEAIQFVTLCKYLLKFGHSESLRLNCHYMYKKYIQKQGL